MATESYQIQINTELQSMDQRLGDLEEKMNSIDGKLTQVVDAIVGNPLVKSGGFIDKIEKLEEKVIVMEKKIEKHDDFKKRITWTIGIIIATVMFFEYVVEIYKNLK